ncbi:myosin heavy chain [Fonticula alba]|uniref:Myosin heavy chain n=1 Tax=Fonticula alba TaxID=691883 RepID=A0A058Z113_FONAL|nr:myosin heavy chain [Fonticula alba]KCV67940.1 myosin heavy chain [Fonticula alba]|eukprot:XP_009497760.1 myosin heavy chain [Fonticula alba]
MASNNSLRDQTVSTDLEVRQQEFAKKKWTWLIDKNEGALAVHIIKDHGGGKITVQANDGKEYEVSQDDLEPMNPPKYDKSEDMATLLHLNESSVLHNLRDRYMSDLIYTYSGLFLVVINPWRNLPIYSDEIIQLYKGKKRKEMPPHIFAVCDEAYRDMLGNKENQSLLITGESGAGKTENTKKVIQYLASVAGTSGTNQSQLEKQIILTNPLLEAFGNAKTIRNNNSSRFGKFIRIEFGSDGKIVGCNIDNYLLEKNRVITHAKAERSFHIFYQLIAGATAEQKKDLLLEGVRAYRYLEGEANIDNVDDAKEFRDTLDAMRIIGFSEEEQTSIWQILSGLLQFGNLEFVGSRRDETASFKDAATADRVSHLLGIKSADFQRCLLKPRVKAGREWVTQMVTTDRAGHNSNALVKAVYERLFKWIISKINSTLETHGRAQTFIGCLDIAGFEIFDHNSFEQLCINLTNEKLQQFFNHHMFVLEQEEYMREGIEWKFVDFGLDLQPTIDLIEKPLGILSILDEECLLPRSTDKTFIEKCHMQHENKHDKYHKPRLNPDMFILDHYAGSVSYNTAEWIEKNKDPINDNVASLFAKSTNPLLATIFEDFQVNDDGTLVTDRKGKASSFITVSQRHKQSLNALISTLRATQPHFVRCIIPNESKKPGMIDAPLVLDQLRCNGVLEGIRIVRLGFPNRIPFAEFKQRYELLAPGIIPKGFMDGRVIAQKLLDALKIEKEFYRIGQSKVFFKAGTVAELEERRDARLSELISGFQAAARGALARRAFRRQHGKEEAIQLIQKNARVFIDLYQWSWWKLYRSIKPLLGVHRQDQQEKALKDRIAELEAQLEREAAAAREAAARASELEKDNRELETDLDTARNAHAEAVASYKNSEERRQKLATIVSDMEAQADEYEQEIDTLAESNRKAQADIKSLKAQLDDDSKARAAVEEAKAQSQRELELLKSQHDLDSRRQAEEAEAERAKQAKALAEAAAKAEALSAQLERAKKDAKSASAEKDSLQAELDALQAQLREADKAKRQLESELRDAQTETRQVTSRLEAAEAAKAEAEARGKKLNDQIEEALTSRAVSAQQVENAQAEIEDLRNELAEANKAKATAEQALKSAEAKIDQADDQLHEEVSKRKDLDVQIVALQAENASLADKLAKANDAADNSLMDALRAERAKVAALEEKNKSDSSRRLAAEEKNNQLLEKNSSLEAKIRSMRELFAGN